MKDLPFPKASSQKEHKANYQFLYDEYEELERQSKAINYTGLIPARAQDAFKRCEGYYKEYYNIITKPQ